MKTHTDSIIPYSEPLAETVSYLRQGMIMLEDW